jgi:hypothetical protein
MRSDRLAGVLPGLSRACVARGTGVRWILALVIIIILVFIVARTPNTHCETLKADGNYDRRGCE